MRIRQNIIEQSLLDFESYSSKKEITHIKILIIKSFFEIYDYLVGTQHSVLVNSLYFNHGILFNNLEKVAQEYHIDISTLRRYRQQYKKIFCYVKKLPKGSSTVKLITELQN